MQVQHLWSWKKSLSLPYLSIVSMRYLHIISRREYKHTGINNEHCPTQLDLMHTLILQCKEQSQDCKTRFPWMRTNIFLCEVNVQRFWRSFLSKCFKFSCKQAGVGNTLSSHLKYEVILHIQIPLVLKVCLLSHSEIFSSLSLHIRQFYLKYPLKKCFLLRCLTAFCTISSFFNIKNWYGDKWDGGTEVWLYTFTFFIDPYIASFQG